MSGTVTSPTGSVNGYSLTGLQDAEDDYWSATGGTYDTSSPPVGTAKAQAQHQIMLSNVVGPCGRHGGGGTYAGGELILRFRMIAYADLPASVTTIPPAADLPLVFTANVWLRTSDGAYRVVQPEFMRATKNGGAGTAYGATSGSVTFTRMDATAYDAAYDLYFGSDHVTGSFSAPWC